MVPPTLEFLQKKSRPLAVITQLKISLKIYEKRRVSYLPLKLKKISQDWAFAVRTKVYLSGACGGQSRKSKYLTFSNVIEIYIFIKDFTYFKYDIFYG